MLASTVLFTVVFAAIVREGSYPGMFEVPTIYKYRQLPPVDRTLDLQVLLSLDRNRDGWLDEVERSAPKAQRLGFLFRRASIDDDGRILVREVEQMLFALEYPFP